MENSRKIDGDLDSVETIDIGAFEAQLPKAKAGTDLTVNAGENVVLDARSSSDTDGKIKSYSWSIIQGTLESLQRINTDSPVANIVKSSVPVILAVTVKDDLGFTDTDEIKLTVNPIQPSMNSSIEENPMANNSGDAARVENKKSNTIADVVPNEDDFAKQNQRAGNISADNINSPNALAVKSLTNQKNTGKKRRRTIQI